MTGPVPGALVFARFAYPPNALGYCGPSDPAALLQAASDGGDVPAVAALAARFDGAWPYLQLIASCAGIDDPLDRRVVEAYWIGGTLLDRVPPAALLAHLRERFGDRTRPSFAALAEAAWLGGAAHHSFHVFAVYPWFGLLRGGMDGAPMTVLDRCRIRWGTVLAVDGDRVTVRDRGLRFDGSRLGPGAPRCEVVRRGLDGVGFTPDLAPGDTVALHWDWVCGRLTGSGLARLRWWSRRSLDAVNAASAPGPAVACDRRS